MAYDAVHAKGANSLDNDWGTTPADIAARNAWQQVLKLGIGGKDPFNGQKISKDEYYAAKNGSEYFEGVIKAKMGYISNFMIMNYYSEAKKLNETNSTEYNYNLFLQKYMKNVNGIYYRIENMWEDLGNGNFKPKKPGN